MALIIKYSGFEGFLQKKKKYVYFRETLNYILFKTFSIAITFPIFLTISEFRDKKKMFAF